MTTVALQELPRLAQSVLADISLRRHAGRACVIALAGNLGAGKTTFVQALAREMGVTDVVQSPTYVLMKSYPVAYQGFELLVHIDAYRLESPEQFAALGPQTFLQNEKALVLIEWPERLEGVLPKPDMTIWFSADDMMGKERVIEIV
jgi:tRNA threonylcarbamoyladenosine biosynthesis protein TsaE